nr:helix-turn-helix domain-containing protein [Candidatus Njordarchaeum guaymaensis]
MHSNTEIARIDADLGELEHRVLDRLVGTSIGLGRDPILASIMAHLYLRRELTQKDLQDLTRYSAGAISEALKLYVEEGIVEERKPQGRGSLTYKVENMRQFTARLLLASVDLTLSYEDECRKVQRGLEEMPESARSERLYVGLHEFVSLFFKFLPIYKSIREIINQGGEVI